MVFWRSRPRALNQELTTMTVARRFEDLDVWQKARELNKTVYAVSNAGVFARDFKLRDQARGASLSIMANIAEGFERGGNREFSQFLSIAKGSCGELRSHLYAALDVGYVTQQQHQQTSDKAVEVSRMISGLMGHLSRSEMRGSKYSQ
jgi:four helix bundle protein